MAVCVIPSANFRHYSSSGFSGEGPASEELLAEPLDELLSDPLDDPRIVLSINSPVY